MPRFDPSLAHQFLPKCFLGLSLQTQFSFRFWRSHFAPKKPNFIQTCHESNNSEAGTFVNRDSVVDKFCFIEITDLPQESQFKLWLHWTALKPERHAESKPVDPTSTFHSWFHCQFDKKKLDWIFARSEKKSQYYAKRSCTWIQNWNGNVRHRGLVTYIWKSGIWERVWDRQQIRTLAAKEKKKMRWEWWVYIIR